MSAIFTPLEIRTLQTAVNQIIPADDYPSGWDAGVGDYLERLVRRDSQLLSIYRAGLSEGQPSEDFLPMLTEHVFEGFYADPGNGGNKDGVAWRMIGYEVTA